MIFFALTDSGLVTRPIVAASLSDAADQLRVMFGAGLNGDGVTPVNVAALIPAAVAMITPASDPTKATITVTGDAATQQTIRNNASQALATNATYLGLANPTTAQAVAQVAALTRQIDALIRLAVANFSGTT